MEKKKSYLPMFCIVIILMSYTLLNPHATAFYAQSSIKMCASSLVPTLFVFMVFSRMLSHICASSDFNGKAVLLLSRLFNLPPCLIPICISGLFCGAPSGAFAICRLYDDGFCKKDEAERACILSNNCSAAFILGFISTLIGSKEASLYIFISNISATIFVYMIFFRDGKNNGPSKTPHRKKIRIAEIITESISSSVTATVTLYGYVIFFYTFTQLLCDSLIPFFKTLPLTNGKTAFLGAAICSFFEITSGILRISEAGGIEGIVLCAGAAAFTGLSMIFQVLGIMTKSALSWKRFIFSKCLCAFLSPIFVIILLLFSPFAVSVSYPAISQNYGGVSYADVFSLVIITFIAFVGAYLLYCLDKKHKK